MIEHGDINWYRTTGHCGQCGQPGNYCLCTDRHPCGCRNLHPVGAGLKPDALDAFNDTPPPLCDDQLDIFGGGS